MDSRGLTAFIIVLLLLLGRSTVTAQLIGFDDYSWQQKDSIITTLYQGGAYNVTNLMITQAYRTEKNRPQQDPQALAVFSTWQGVRCILDEKLDSAGVYWQEAIDIYQSNPTLQDSSFRDVLLNMGDLLSRQGSADQSLEMYAQALELLDADGRRNKKLYLNTLASIIAIGLNGGDPDNAEKHARLALQFSQQEYGENSDEYFSALTNLGNVFRLKGENRRADNLILQAYALAKANLPEDHINRILYANNAVEVYNQTGRITSAGEVYDEMVQFFEDNPQHKEGPAYPLILDRKAAWHETRGELDIAYEFYNKANVLLALRVERTSPEYIQSQLNMANILTKQEKFLEAEGYYVNAIRYAPEAFGENSWSMAAMYEGLGDIYREMEDYDQAATQLTRAIEIYEANIRLEDPALARTSEKLGLVHQQLGLDSLAEENYLQAQKIYLDLYGREHPDFFKNGLQLSSLYWHSDPPKAHEYLHQAKTYALQALWETTPLLNLEDQQIIFREIYQYINLLTSFSLTYPEQPLLDDLGDVMTAWNLSRGQSNLVLLASYQPELGSTFRTKFNTWQNLRKQIVDLQRVGNRSEQYQALKEEAKKIQGELIVGYQRYYDQILDTKDLRSRLAMDAIHIEFFTAVKIDPTQNDDSDQVEHFALLNKGKASKAELIALEVNQNALLTSQARNQSTYYQQIWKPLEPHLEGTSTITISASGALSKVSYGSLPSQDGGFLIDDYEIRRVPSMSMAIQNASSPVRRHAALVMANPDFRSEMDSTPAISKTFYHLRIPSGHNAADENKPPPNLVNIPRSSMEATLISKLLGKKKWETRLITGDQASKTQVYQAAESLSPGILHLATKVYDFSTIDENDSSPPDHTMLSVGLALAGSNASNDDHPNGLWSALEISVQDLSSVDLVIYGYNENTGSTIQDLINAFSFSGVSNQLISLWETSSEAREAFFKLFYKDLVKGRSVGESYDRAIRKMRKKSDPADWGGFILITS